MLYVIALSWLLVAAVGLDDWYLHTCQAILLVVPLGFFALQCLRDSGARPCAAPVSWLNSWPDALIGRPTWTLAGLLPEVKALREALHVDAGPALELLNHVRPQVRVAALAALEFRQNWQPGQAELVLSAARRALEPEIRAAAVYALANRDDQEIIEGLAEFLYDPSHGVRQAATEALLWNTEYRWPWIRMAVRRCLSDPACQQDGALRLEGKRLTAEAVTDLTGWAAEKGCLAVRAALTLGIHYGQVLAAGRDPELNAELLKQLTDPHAPAVLRLVLARLLHHHRELDGQALRQLLDSIGAGACAVDGGGSPDGGRKFAGGRRRPVRLGAAAEPRDRLGHGRSGATAPGRGHGFDARPAGAADP